MFDLKRTKGKNQPATKAFEILFYGAYSKKVIPPAGHTFQLRLQTGRGELAAQHLKREADKDRRSAQAAIGIAGLGILLAAAAGGLYWLQHRKPAAPAAMERPEEKIVPPLPLPEPEPQPIVMMRYDDEEIDHLLDLIPETNRLTGRELEVLREILHGRKQGEVAYYLGIEVSTVKDFYRKIYDKLGVPNKDGLFRMVSEQLLHPIHIHEKYTGE